MSSDICTKNKRKLFIKTLFTFLWRVTISQWCVTESRWHSTTSRQRVNANQRRLIASQTCVLLKVVTLYILFIARIYSILSYNSLYLRKFKKAVLFQISKL